MIDFASLSSQEAIKLPMEDFKAWLAYLDQDPPPPNAYPLSSNEGRCGFLEAYIWRGEVALFEAVAHIWSLLNEPKSLRCLYIGIHAGTGGSGKLALAKCLRRALRESLDYPGREPWGRIHLDIHQFHKVVMSYFDAQYHHYQLTIQKYADILGGEPGRHLPSPSAEVIPGPWIALPSHPEAEPADAADWAPRSR